MRAKAPLTIEEAGIVEQVGAAVTTVKVGDHVIMSAAYCGHCIQCRSGRVAWQFIQDLAGRLEVRLD